METDAEIDEEIIADQFEDVAKRTGLFQSIAGKNRGLIERVVQWLKDTMNKFIEHFRNPQGKLTTEQATRLADEFGRIANQLKDPNGQKIFRYNRLTHNIELADGRGLFDSVQIKKDLTDLARAAWNDRNFNGKVSFTPSKKFRDKAQELFGHDIDTVFITGSDIRHIKSSHGTGEESRGQINIREDDIAQIYDTVNDFDSATRERDDNLGNKNIMVIKANNGTNYVLLVERGKSKAQVKTFYKTREASQVLGANSSSLNVRNDPVRASDKNIAQSEREGNIKYSIGNSNSSESLAQKIKNKVSAWISSPNSNRRRAQITANLRRLNGHRILYGYMDGTDDVVVNHLQKLIQSRKTYDWEKLLPVVGEEIAKNLNLNATKAQSNYIADWLLTGALNILLHQRQKLLKRQCVIIPLWLKFCTTREKSSTRLLT